MSIADPFINNIFIQFPPVDEASEEGLVAYGGNLEPNVLLSAYAQGIFPWYNKDPEILWWSPDPRMVLYPSEFKVSKSLKQKINKRAYTLKIDTCFDQVISNCSAIKRNGETGTWITPNMRQAYINIHNLGYAHSFEIFIDGMLAGGLYGVSIGKAFFGESMFHNKTDASKLALYHLVEFCKKNEIKFIDVQQSTDHLKSLGATDIDRNDFIKILNVALKFDTIRGKWTSNV